MDIRVPVSVSNPAVQDVLSKQLRYHYPAVMSVSFDDSAVTLCVEGTDGAIEETLPSLVVRIANSFSRVPLVPVRVVYDSAKPHSRAHDRHNGRAFGEARDLLAAELATEAEMIPDAQLVDTRSPAARGLNYYGQAAAALQTLLDRFLRRYFQLAYRAQELRVPSMIPISTLERAGYLQTARQHLNWVSSAKTDPDSFNAFPSYWQKALASETPLGGEVFHYLKPPDAILNPAMCVHCYPLLQGMTVAKGHPRVLTLSGSCFRDESGNLNNADRLREFWMREAVFVGDPATLNALHGELLDFIIQLGSTLGFTFRVETANDIFFADGAPERLFSQLTSDNKLELAAYPNRTSERLAVISINKHQNHFTEAFGITTDDGQTAVSMCIGFGLDRLGLALALQHDAGGPGGLTSCLSVLANSSPADHK